VALILEVLAQGRHAEVRERRAVGGAITIGRALDNDVVLDDPHVDAHHARLEPQADGSHVLVDLGSVNGLGAIGGARSDRVVFAPGAVVTIGRTPLRVRTSDEQLPPALPLRATSAGPGPTWLLRTRVRIGIIAGCFALNGFDTWLHATQHGVASQLFSEALFGVVMLAIWAGVWSVAARVVVGRFHFPLHAAFGALGVIAFVLRQRLLDFIAFTIPSFGGGVLAGDLLLFVLLGALVAAHLSAASHLGMPGRRAVGAIAASVVLMLFWVGRAVADDDFTTEATFNGTILTLTPAVLPKESPEEFAKSRARLRAQVDALLEDEGSP